MSQRIIYADPAGGVAVVAPNPDCGLTIEQIAAKDVPRNVVSRIVGSETLPSDDTFRGAWEIGPADGPPVVVSMPKARVIAHAKRRTMRDAEFAPFDKVIALAIPGESTAKAEQKRKEIRVKYAGMQTAIDAASTPEELASLLKQAMPPLETGTPSP